MYKKNVFALQNANQFSQQLLQWANSFNSCCCLYSNGYNIQHKQVEIIIGVNAIDHCIASNVQVLETFLQKHKGKYVFGHLNYEFNKVKTNVFLNNNIEVEFPVSYFFVPSIIVKVNGNTAEIESLQILPETILNTIQNIQIENNKIQVFSIKYQSSVSEKLYVKTVENILKEIQKGNCYELNYCIPFTANASINPLQLFQQLNTISPNPFAAFYKLNNNYLLCASPERYIQKQNSCILSQPIKGTFKRNIKNIEADTINKSSLYNSKKERAENVMVVDLVRNDLSRICKQGSVKVTELFGIYTFPQVHQMVSTIVGEVNEDISFAEVVENTFPMGSMTGAPKTKVMELIEQFEASKRGIYSGTLGYITPENNFDFNVVIRSIVYNATTQQLQYHVGSGITANSNAIQEYEECTLKASAMQQL